MACALSRCYPRAGLSCLAQWMLILGVARCRSMTRRHVWRLKRWRLSWLEWAEPGDSLEEAICVECAR